MEPFDWKKVFDFSGNTVGKILSLVFKVLVIVGLPILAIVLVYIIVIKPHTNPVPTTSQRGTITNVYYYPTKKVFSLGATIWGMDIGVSKYSYPDKPILKEIK